jgi:hypothetical protein
MTRAGFAVAAIVLSATVAVALPEPAIWDHNGSVMYLVANGSSREVYYQKPRPGMLDAGARPGSLLFRGEVNNGQYSGTAYIFNLHCGPIPFEVKGPILDDDKRIVLTGEAPRVDRNCRTYGSYMSNLEFRRLKPNEAAESQEPPPVEVSKPDAPSRNADELPSASKARPSVKNENPVPGKDPSPGVADLKVPSTPTAQASVTSEIPGAKDLDKYKWGAAFVAMIVWLLIVSFGRTLIRRKV